MDHGGRTFDEVIRAYLLMQEEENLKKRDFDWWWGSEMGTCKRKQFLRRLGVPAKEKEWRIKFIIEQGRAIHNWIEEVVRRTGRLIESEGQLKDERLRYKGRFDLIVNLGNEKKPYLSLVDIKTQRPEAFFRRARSPQAQKVKRFQKLQLASYFLFARKKYPNIKDARIYYLDRGGGVRDEYVFKFKQGILREVIKELKILNRYWEEGRLPPCQNTWECQDMCGLYKKECELIEKGELSLKEFVKYAKQRSNS